MFDKVIDEYDATNFVEKFCICGNELSTVEEKELDMCEDCLGTSTGGGDPRPLNFED